MPPVVAAILVVAEVVLDFVGTYGSLMLAVASIGFSIYSMATMPKGSGYSADVSGRQQVVRSAVAPHRVVYGKCLISGPLVSTFSHGTNNDILYLIVALTSHEVAGIDDVYLGDTVSTDIKYCSCDGKTWIEKYESYIIPPDGKVETTYAIAKVFSVIKYPIGSIYSTVDPSLYTVNGRIFTFDSSLIGIMVTIHYRKSFVQITKYLGTQDQAADPELLAHAKDHAGNKVWTSAHTLTGRSYLVVRLEYDATVFATGLPNIKAIVRGVNDIYDPRTETTGWTDNAALCVRDYITKSYGIGCSDINDDNFIAAANICDEQVAVAVGSGTGYLTDGQYYESGVTGINLISGTGTILAGDTVTITIAAGDYIINGTSTHFPASANSYTVETALTSGFLVLGGSGLSAAIPPTNCIIDVHTFNQENRYSCNGSFTLDAKPVDIMKQMLTSCAGRLVWSQGAYSIFPAAYNYPVGTLTESDLRDDISLMPAPSRQQRFNTVRGTFVSPDQYWQQIDFPMQQNAAQYAADGNEICQTLELPYTLSASMAQRLAAIFLNQNLRGISVTFPAKLSAFPYQPGDVVNLSITQLGWSDKGFRITAWKLSDTGGVDLILKEEDPSVYGWTLSDQKPFSPPAKTYIASYSISVPDVTNFSAFQNGAFVVFGWDDVNSNIAGYDIRYNPVGNTTWDQGTPITVINKGTHLVSQKVIPGSWTFMICARDVLGNYSQNPATCDLTVTNYNVAITSTIDQSQLGWPGTLTNFIVHPSGVLVPLSQGVAADDDWNTFDKFCVKPYATYTYLAPEIVLTSDVSCRALAALVEILGIGETGLATPQLQIQWKTSGIAYNDLQNWTVGQITANAVKMQFTMTTATGLGYINSFVPLLDQPGVNGGNAS